jgi:hypothetical protein
LHKVQVQGFLKKAPFQKDNNGSLQWVKGHSIYDCKEKWQRQIPVCTVLKHPRSFTNAGKPKRFSTEKLVLPCIINNNNSLSIVPPILTAVLNWMHSIFVIKPKNTKLKKLTHYETLTQHSNNLVCCTIFKMYKLWD